MQFIYLRPIAQLVEHAPYKREVNGSSPFGPISLNYQFKILNLNFKILILNFKNKIYYSTFF